MLEFASQRGFRERTRHRVSVPATSGNTDGSGCFDPLGKNAGLPKRSEHRPGTESVPGSSESREIGHAKEGAARAGRIPAVTVDPLCCGEPTTR